MSTEKEKEIARKSYARNREKRLAQKKLYYGKKRENVLEKSKQRYAENREEIRRKQNEHYAKHQARPRGPSTFDKKAYQRDYYLKNKPRLLANQRINDAKRVDEKRKYNRERYWENRDTIREQQAKWRKNNKEWTSSYNRKYKQENPEKYREGMRRYWERNGQLRGIGGEMRRCLKGHPKATRYWEKMVGYTLEDLMAHLEGQFKNGMSWDNHGEWHIDHIKPVSEFGADQAKECWSLNNLQPLWAEDNVAKGVEEG